jgi:hypothetical protein
MVWRDVLVNEMENLLHDESHFAGLPKGGRGRIFVAIVL